MSPPRLGWLSVIDHEQPPSHCVYCLCELDAAYSSSARPPQPGDVSICIECAGILIFTGDGLRAPTMSEWRELTADDHLMRMRDMMLRTRR